MRLFEKHHDFVYFLSQFDDNCNLAPILEKKAEPKNNFSDILMSYLTNTLATVSPVIQLTKEVFK